MSIAIERPHCSCNISQCLLVYICVSNRNKPYRILDNPCEGRGNAINIQVYAICAYGSRISTIKIEKLSFPVSICWLSNLYLIVLVTRIYILHSGKNIYLGFMSHVWGVRKIFGGYNSCQNIHYSERAVIPKGSLYRKVLSTEKSLVPKCHFYQKVPSTEKCCVEMSL